MLSLVLFVDVFFQGIVYRLLVYAFGVECVLYLDFAPFVELGLLAHEGSRISLFVDELVLLQLLDYVVGVVGSYAPLFELEPDVALAMLRLDA